MIGSVEFNGLTILSESKKENVSGRVSMNVWIFPGENKIKVKGIHKRKKDESAPYLTATLYLAQKEQPYNEGRKIADFEWGEVEGKPSLPFEQEITFSPTEVPPCELWKVAEKIQLTEEDKQKIQKLIIDLHDGLQKKDEKKLLELMEFKTKEYARAYYDSPEEDIKNFKKIVLEGVFQMIGGKLDKIDFKKLQYQLISDQKVVAVTSQSGSSPITNKAKGFSMPLYFSKIKGEWILSR
ncbi:hypothetical protein LEP1GSC151_5030 [Leptospira interrogans serovar Grippotyphosa str. LT2186]|uniref:Uncharacterized protein n=3 Tax=Leptospira interrogans TaxID=173 RepID=M3IA16_LEPIR|nr:hypothetical protein [Leptospira interrogans]EMF42962.1 hypothetical protein LEP1GSC067_2596 [Leptospira interrogans serovar Lora str. TE 1992]EMF71303.1 hypothetical protein LEP1GSC148_3676 [Leptospira interrogans serovar Canicola str. LT1962]EMG12211.1 hypothetical protein LEP1GSC151_5030 [Leptospira interrogans serovar Grippotyphosa str. LT2186]AKH76108.1 hypothetical protein BRAT_02915 [Leptospira interrogans serovar Bratislava]EJP15461.1 hypothetical protein LEP1GSC080_3559 [Leptospira